MASGWFGCRWWVLGGKWWVLSGRLWVGVAGFGIVGGWTKTSSHFFFFASEKNLLHKCLAIFFVATNYCEICFLLFNKFICDTTTETKQIGTNIVITFFKQTNKNTFFWPTKIFKGRKLWNEKNLYYKKNILMKTNLFYFYPLVNNWDLFQFCIPKNALHKAKIDVVVNLGD